MEPLRPFLLWSLGDRPVRQVSGEHYRADQIRTLFPTGRLVSYGDRLNATARLVPEPHNQYDRNAVAVIVDRVHVGYLAREEAAVYQPVITELNRSGYEALVPCTVTGNEYWTTEEDRRGRPKRVRVFDPTVTLVLDEWYRCVPVNFRPNNDVLLPPGAAVQVQKEEDHQDVVQRFVNANGEAWAYGTLHAIAGGTAKAPTTLVEVRIDGSRVGQLTPATSAHFLPSIEAAGRAGKTLGAQLIVKGNRIKAEVIVHAKKAHELDAAWVAQAFGVPARPPIVTAQQFNPAPGWPVPPPGWTPPPGWQPHPDWPPAPAGWRFWV